MAARLEFSIVLSEIHLIYCTNYGKFLKGRATRLRKACGQCGQVMQALQQQQQQQLHQQQQQQQQIYFTLVADAFYKFGTLDHKKWFEPWQKSVKLQMASPWIDKLLILLPPLPSPAAAAAATSTPLFIAISGSCPVWHRID